MLTLSIDRIASFFLAARMAHTPPTLLLMFLALMGSDSVLAQQPAPDDEIFFGSERRAPPAAQAFPHQDESEEIDLGDGSESALAPQAISPPPCDASLPSGGIVGLWAQNMGSTPRCPARMLAKSQLAIAAAAHESMWCSDPGGLKAKARAVLRESFHAHDALAKAREERLLAPARSRAPLAAEGFMGLWTPPVSKRAAEDLSRLSPLPSPPNFAADPSAIWDAREAQACRLGPQALPAELGPALSAYAAGKISTPQGSCDAILVEATLLTGRHPARASWIASARCPGFVQPDAESLAAALASGPAAAQAWQAAQLARWGWQGKDPRPAYSRSSSAPPTLGFSDPAKQARRSP